ncbi:MAG: helix-turn-helix domain-containing protein [Haloarculaceae archaeon]
MSVVAEFTVPHEELALAETFAADPDLVLAVERLVAQPDGATLQYVWARGDEGRAERLLAADSTTADVRRHGCAGSDTLYEVAWTPAVDEWLAAFLDNDATVLAMVGCVEGWTVLVRVPEHTALGRIQATLRERGSTTDLVRFRAPGVAAVGSQFALSEKQREAVAAAHGAGYYEIPRRITMAELGGELGISQQALSNRLRRAHDALAQSLLHDDAGVER